MFQMFLCTYVYGDENKDIGRVHNSPDGDYL